MQKRDPRDPRADGKPIDTDDAVAVSWFFDTRTAGHKDKPIVTRHLMAGCGTHGCKHKNEQLPDSVAADGYVAHLVTCGGCGKRPRIRLQGWPQ